MPRLTSLCRVTVMLAALAIVPPSRSAAQTIAITGGTIHPVSGPVIPRGTVLIREGKIVAVGADVAVPADAQRVDAAGKIVTPGLVNAASQIGITEIGAVPGTRNAGARGREGIAASFTVWEGLNPVSVLIPLARDGGITSVLIAPRGGLISGQAAVLQLVDGSAADMILRSPVAMVGHASDPAQAGAQSRGELLLRLREVFEDARTYQRRRAEFERAQTRTFAASRLDLEALVPVVDGRLPMILEVDKASDIESALKLARDYNLRLVIAGAAEAWMVADKLAAARIPVMTGAMNNIPQSFASLGARQENAGLLRRAGVSVIIIGNAGGGSDDAFNGRNVRYEAGNAVAYGMSRDDALRAITLTPAETFGVANRIGSLEAGKDADVVVWSGDPFEFASQPERVLVRGREIRAPSRHDLLEQRYKSLPPDYLRRP